MWGSNIIKSCLCFSDCADDNHLAGGVHWSDDAHCRNVRPQTVIATGFLIVGEVLLATLSARVIKSG